MKNMTIPTPILNEKELKKVDKLVDEYNKYIEPGKIKKLLLMVLVSLKDML